MVLTEAAPASDAVPVTIRDAQPDDITDLTTIYNDVIATSTAIFRDQTVTAADRRVWIEARYAAGFPVLVATDATGLVGFSSFGDFRAFPGYRYTVEHTVHVRTDRRGAGAGRALVEALFPRAHALGKHVMIGAIDAANTGSIRFHERLGFEATGTLREVGRKHGRWLDLVFMARLLDSPGAARPD